MRFHLTFSTNRLYSKLFLTLFTFILLAGTVDAATRYSVATGNWASTSTWSATSGGGAGASVPVAGDVVYIEGGFTVTVAAATSAACATLSIASGSNVTNNGTLTVSTTLSGTGTLINGTDATLNYGGTAAGINPTLTATATGNTVNYTAAGAQTGKITTYFNLTLSGSGVKTFSTTPTVNGTLSMEGTATITVSTGVVTYGTNAALQYNTATARTATTEEWLGTFAGTGGVIIANTGIITAGGAKTFSTASKLTINSGATLAMGSNLLTMNGDIVNGGGTTTGSGGLTITGTKASQSIGAFTTTGTVSMTKTSGTATLTGNVNGAGLTINGTGGTLDLGTGLTHTFTGIWTRTAGTLNGGSSTLKIGGSISGTGGTFTANAGTVEWNLSGAQTCAILTYNNLTLSGSGLKTFTTTPTVNGLLSMEGTATVTVGTGVITYGPNATLRYKGSAAQVTSSKELITTFAGSGGLIIDNSAGVTLGASSTISASLTFVNGKLNTSTFTLSMGSTATISGAGAGKYVYGNLLYNVGTGTSTKSFEIGDATNYVPVTVQFNSVTVAGTLTATTTGVDHPEIGYSEVDPTKSVNRYWTLTSAGGLTLSNYTATFTFVSGDVDAGTNASTFILRKYQSSAWTAPVQLNNVSSLSIMGQGYTTFGDFQVGNLASSLFKLYTTTGSGSFTVPSGVTSITAQCLGGGGAGGGGTGNPANGGGGAGGAFAYKTIATSPGTVYSLSVAAGVSGSTAAGSTGNASWFGSTTTVYAPGGAGGARASSNSSNGNGGTGSTTGYYGDGAYNGGNGANGIFTSGTPGGAGGGGAGTTGVGGNATTGTGGTGTSLYGGNGANGVANSTPGAAGSTYGGGGSGGKANSNTDRAGGAGAQGLVRVTWNRVDPDLMVQLAVSNATPTYGVNVTFTVTATNNGPSNATTVSVTDILPSGYHYVSHAAPGGTTYTLTNGIWAIGNLNSGSSLSLTITALVICNGNYTNSATISGSQPDPLPTNNSASIATTPAGGTCPLIAVDDVSTVLQATPINISVLLNDIGNYVASSTIELTQPQNGSLTNNNGVFTYTPIGSFTGTDQFTYRIFDNTSPTPNHSDATVTITVVPNFTDVCIEAVYPHTYYMPFPENETQLGLALYNASNSSGQGSLTNYVRNVTSIKSSYPNVVIVYDQWEDGYEADITVPTQSSTLIWGDGNLTNGVAPGHPTDILPPGAGIILDNTFIYKPRNSADIYFDGKDKIYSTQDVAISKVTGDDTWFALQAAKTDVYDLNLFSQSFTIGLGEDITVPTGVTAFKYACLFVRAAYDGTTVSLDYDGSGTVDATQTLNEGQVWFWEGTQATTNATVDLKIGATVTADKPVGVDILFGGKDNWGTRNFNIFPSSYYGDTYYTPVPQVNASYPNAVYFYNPSNSAITIDWNNGAPSSGTVTVAAKSFNYLSLTGAYGYKFRSQLVSGTRPKFVASQVNCVPNGTTGADFDWAFPLIPEEQLTNFTSIAWAPGSKDLTRNDDPLWVSPVENTTIYVKNDGDLTEIYPPASTSPCGLPYDQAITLNALNFTRIRDLADNDQSGTALYTCGSTGGLDGVKFSAVWGEDPSTALTGNPSIDVGTCMEPRCLGQLIIANDDFEETPPNTPVIINVAGNDYGFLCTPNPASLRNTGLLQPAHGSVTLNPDGTITYTPNNGYTGTDVFEYMICALEYVNVCDMATVTVTITTCSALSTENKINGKVFIQQLPDDGIYNGTEVFVGGIQVDLYGDPNGNGIVDNGEFVGQTTISDLSGNYQFTTFSGYKAADDFDPAAGFSGNDGTVIWSSNWLEQGDDLNYTTGDVRIMADPSVGASGNAIRIDGPSNGISRSLAFSNATGNATLTLKYRRQALLNNGAALQIQVNGTTLYNINDGDGVGTDNYYHDLSVTIPPANYNANGTNTVQIISTSGLTTAEYYWVDNVVLSYFTSAASKFIVKVNPTNTNGDYIAALLNQQNITFNALGTCSNDNYLGVIPQITDLAITKTDYAVSFGPGGEAVYTVVVSNNGPANVTNGLVNDPLPSNGTSMSWSAVTAGGATVTHSSGSGSIVNESVDVPVGGTVTYTITVNVKCDAAGNLENTATITAPILLLDTDLSNNSATDIDIQNIWTGTTSTEWENPSNWSIGVPSCNPPLNAVIPAGTPFAPFISTNNTFAAHLYVAEGAVLTVLPGKDLTVCGCATINGENGLTLRSNPSGNSCFINQGEVVYGPSGFANVELYLTKSDTVVGHECRGCWHYVSPPVSTSTATVFFGDFMKYWTENGTPSPTYDGWSLYVLDPNFQMHPAVGYAVSRKDGMTSTPYFNGYLNVNSYTKSLTRTVGAGYGYNLLGNPYTAYLDLESPDLDWTDVDPKVWYYSMLKGNYNIYIKNGVSTGTRYCPPMQGFFVHVASTGTTGSFTFSPTARVTSGDTTFYKSSEIVKDVLHININKKNEAFFDEAIVNFRPDASKGFDRALDGSKMWGTEEAPQLFTISDDGDYLSINCLDYLDENIVIPLHFLVQTNGTGTYKMKFTGMESFDYGDPMYLEDLKQGNYMQDITINPVYEFDYVQNDDQARFLLHFKNPVFGIKEGYVDRNARIYASEKSIFVKSLTDLVLDGKVSVFNLLGVEVASAPINHVRAFELKTNLEKGYYVVRYTGKNFTSTAKVFIK